MTLPAGARLGPFEVQSLLGAGGMGEVYKALDTRLARAVALKVLPHHIAADPDFRERFQREARAISSLNHPHICAIHDVGEAPDPTGRGEPIHYLVMEYLEGQTLAERLERGRLTLEQTLHFGIQVARALESAHRAGIVHRDLKPANIMLTRSGAKLLDFGMAKVREAGGGVGGGAGVTVSDETRSLTGQGTIVGTLQYMSPEQLEGRPADARSDIFAFGAVLYEMLTGTRAFAGSSQASVIAAILEREPAPPSALQPLTPPGLDRVIRTCLAKDPDARWQSAGDLVLELQWAGDSPQPGGGAGAPVRRSSWSRLAWVAAGVLAVVVAILGWQLTRQEPQAARPVVRASVLLPDGVQFPTIGSVSPGGRLALSPNGRWLAIAAVDAAGIQRLWVRGMDGLVAQPVTGTEGAISPFWSPDSRSIGFTAQGKLKRVDVLGGQPVVICDTDFFATGSWSRDDVILFTPAPGAGLHRVPATGGMPVPVTEPDPDAGDVDHRNPYFLPDGRHFLYLAVGSATGGPNDPRAIYVGSLDQTEPARLLIEGGSNAKYATERILFLRGGDLVAQAFDPDALALTGDPIVVAEQIDIIGSAATGAFTVSDTGVLAYRAGTGQASDLVWIDRQGRRLGVLAEGAEFGDVELSPDGARAAVSVLDPTRGTRDIWLVDTTSGQRTRFTFDPADDVAPIWRPDGSGIVFTSRRTGQYTLFEKAASGAGSESALPLRASDAYPVSLTPDGRQLLFWTAGGATGNRLWLAALDGDEAAAPLVEGPSSPGRFSPDGQWVAYYTSESGRFEVYVRPFPDDNGRWQVSSGGGNLVRWSRDGTELFFVAPDGTLMAARVDAAAGAFAVPGVQRLFQARPAGPRYFYDVTPDGQRFLVNTPAEGGDASSITLVLNWTGSARVAPLRGGFPPPR